MVTAERFIVAVLPGFQPQGEERYLTCVGGFCLVCSDRIPLHLHSLPIHLKISSMSFEVYSLRCTIRVGNSNRSAFQNHAVRDFKTGGFLSNFLFRLFYFFPCDTVPVLSRREFCNKTLCLRNVHTIPISSFFHNLYIFFLQSYLIYFFSGSIMAVGELPCRWKNILY